MFDGSAIMPFHALNYTPHKLGSIDRHRTLYKTRLNPVLAIPSSPILLQTDESGNYPESNKGSTSSLASTGNESGNSLLGLANTVGIIGGMSVDSTLKFLRKLVQRSSKEESSVPFVLCSDPVLNKELLLHERNFLPSLSSKSGTTQLDPTPIVENLRSKRAYLENSGARCIVMPCHISHSWHEEISKGCSVPFFHMGECVAKQLKEAKLRPLEAGSPLRIGILATNATLTAGFYQEKLQNEVIYSVALVSDCVGMTCLGKLLSHNLEQEFVRM